MNRTALALVVSILLVCLFESVVVAQDCNVVREAVKEVTRIRRLNEKRSVRCKIENKEQVEKYLRKALSEQIPLEKIKSEETVFKFLGIIPDDFNYLEGLIELYTSQLGGYYDPKGKYYTMASWLPKEMQFTIAVHELTHALQDQHFDLERFIDHEKMTSDELLAHSALVEGDATITMLDYTRSLSGQKRLGEEPTISKEIIQSIIGGMMGSGGASPISLRQVLVFPYASGLNFAHALQRKGGIRAINRAYKNQPRTTEQILHPDKFLRGQADFIEIEKVEIPDSYKALLGSRVYSDSLGEFLTSVLLGSAIDSKIVRAASEGWAGDRLELYTGAKESDDEVLVWESRWDSSRDSEEFLAALRMSFEQRLGEKATSTGVGFSIRGAKYRKIEASRRDKQVLLLVAQ